MIDKGLVIAEETGEHLTDPHLHRLRGDILLKFAADTARAQLADTARAQQAYKTAIAIAKRQGARSYQLLAALSLAKLYQSTARPAEAQAVLAPALEGFSPTPEMPEIDEAQALGRGSVYRALEAAGMKSAPGKVRGVVVEVQKSLSQV